MINYHNQLVAALNGVLPTHYEMVLHSGLATPCISYMENNNFVEESGDTIEYSRLSYTIKIWSNKISELQEYAVKLDAALRPLGWKRTASGELYDNNSSMIQKIMTYEARALENY